MWPEDRCSALSNVPLPGRMPPHRCNGYTELQRRFTLRATGGSET